MKILHMADTHLGYSAYRKLTKDEFSPCYVSYLCCYRNCGCSVVYVDNLLFHGDITSLYATGDQVQISVTVKRVTFTLESPDVLTEMTYDLEIFEKQWESKEYFVANGASANGLKPLPQSSIAKV
ncbi:unnamed protein product [marine sediment metagenome]|uniref:Uncharacterized protein n=1 Tax=marine sediment metagenome TaxID=412755 RepID=X1S4P0_9ZZZZ